MSAWIFFRLRAERVQPPGHAVIEPCADIQHHVAIMHREIGFVRAVHAQHAQELLVAGRIGAEPHQGGGDRKAGEPHELPQQFGGLAAGIDDAAAGIHHRPRGALEQRHRLGDALRVRRGARPVAAMRGGTRLLVRRRVDENVLGQVDQHRAGAPGAGHMERLMHHAGEIARAFHQIIMLGRLARDAGGVGLLEGVIADQMRGHLAGQADQGDAVHQRIHQPGHRVGRARAGGDQHHADFAGGPGIALGGMHRRLLVPHENVADLVLLENRVVDRQDRAARIAENNLDALRLEGPQQGLRA